MTKSLLAALCVVVLAGTGCGNESSDDPTLTQSSESPGVQGPQGPSLTGCASAAPTVAPPAGASKDMTKKPPIEIPDTAPPCGLQIADIVVGTGRVAAAGQTLSMQYVGVTYADGREFDTSWGGTPFQFTLGEGRVIQGWDQGIGGMKEGGRRQLIIPAELGYGEQGAGTDIPPGATLVFIVDLLKVG